MARNAVICNVTSILDNAYPLGFFKHVSETQVPTLGQGTEIDSIWENLYPSTSVTMDTDPVSEKLCLKNAKTLDYDQNSS